jgi:RHS repeat-associated protein
MQLTFTGNNNRMDGYTYDTAGNVTYDLNNNYTYDAENRIASVTGTLGTTTYIYDAMGQRVRKSVSGATTDYVYDLEGHAIAEVSGSGGWSRGEVFAGGKHIATYANSTTYFSHADWLGTERVRSDMSGAPCETISSLPFGDGQSTSGSCGDPSTRHFTGKERDMESGLDNFGARYNSSNLGRFMSPDPGNISGLLYQSDPQSWNGYAYARNNPLLYTDPDGDVYQICDNDGNCTNISDEDFEKDFQNANNVQLKDNQIYIKDSNGDFQLQGSFKQTSVDDRIGSLAGALPLAGQMAAPGVNLAANGLRAFGYVVAAPLMVTAECLAGAPSCTKGNVAMAILPEVGALREGAILLKEGAAVGKAAEILEKTGGAAQAAKDFEGLQGAEKVYGSTKVKTLSDGTKAVLYKSTSGGSTIALQDAAGRTVTKIRY